MKPLQQRILDFNKFYRLPCPDTPTLEAIAARESLPTRIQGFLKTVGDEVTEGNDILNRLLQTNGESYADSLEFLTEMADWLADLVVYCYSESAKYGIPLDKVLDIIMDSNMSKVDAEGNCRYDEHGKVIKNYEGCQYWKPEPKIRQLLANTQVQANHCGNETAQQGE
jgi:predicted HAD superfamily Cof-like phosphohydrolase